MTSGVSGTFGNLSEILLPVIGSGHLLRGDCFQQQQTRQTTAPAWSQIFVFYSPMKKTDPGRIGTRRFRVGTFLTECDRTWHTWQEWRGIDQPIIIAVVIWPIGYQYHQRWHKIKGTTILNSHTHFSKSDCECRAQLLSVLIEGTF